MSIKDEKPEIVVSVIDEMKAPTPSPPVMVRVREYLLENRMGTLADQSEDIVSRMGRSMADIIKQEKDNINNQ